MPFGFSDDYRDYIDKPRPSWHQRSGAPLAKSSAVGGFGILVGLVVGWTTDLREAPAGVVGGVGGMLLFDFYWRWIKDSLPPTKRSKRSA